jgi:hypothetical protein
MFYISLQKLDLNNDGVITVDEFVNYCSMVSKPTRSEVLSSFSQDRYCHMGYDTMYQALVLWCSTQLVVGTCLVSITADTPALLT